MIFEGLGVYCISANQLSVVVCVFSCSPAFFAEEREALHKKRNKIRLLQQRKAGDVGHFKDLPDDIPMPLVIGTKVTGKETHKALIAYCIQL